MEYNKIKGLLDSYFEGNTTLAEEQLLRDYFKSSNVDLSLVQFAPLFNGMSQAAQEVSSGMIVLPNEQKPNRWWIGIAAMLTIAVGVAGFMFSNIGLSQEEEQALASLKESKKAMMMLSQNLNKGTQTLSLAHQFETTKNKVIK
ncbi:hypothetical protein ULMS_14920 [Patiriisocius marinistellae]|uniref:Uncharacterized protein n=1 Tax=Patiriisocius marinistellae TaxID=2494560 RepID=A0A5J4FXU7_9FLAO|nr:hypothetical protein [Patiriisocius marinistellae]GEQ85984.1 hypothetical protein ULMS_14920 [Patiriisocius marinistellae]